MTPWRGTTLCPACLDADVERPVRGSVVWWREEWGVSCYVDDLRGCSHLDDEAVRERAEEALIEAAARAEEEP